MTDAGGGPDWPLQYALVTSDSGNKGVLDGLLTPPTVAKKIQATGLKADLSATSGPVFVTGIIDEDGRLQALHAIRTADARAQSAVNAVAQWEFLPAQIGGKPVPIKILIGVTVLPAEKVGKQDL
jgi:hypothetical protein